MKIHHLALKVHDLAKIENFYFEVLGLKIIQRHYDEFKQLRSVWMDLQGTILMLEQMSLPDSSANFLEKSIKSDNLEAGWYLLALEIAKSEREIWKTKLNQLGIQIIQESHYSLYFCDPEGNRLALSHYSDSI